MYATKKIDFTYSSATIERRFTLIRELELSKVWYQILLDEEFSLMIMAEKKQCRMTGIKSLPALTW